jgi:hypothetical protein
MGPGSVAGVLKPFLRSARHPAPSPRGRRTSPTAISGCSDASPANSVKSRSATRRVASALAYVVLYDAADQRRLFEVLESRLDPERHQRLEDLVLARGPIPDNILKRIRRASEIWSADRIAEALNGQGIIAGMGGIRWTAKKVRAALVEYERRTANHEAA